MAMEMLHRPSSASEMWEQLKSAKGKLKKLSEDAEETIGNVMMAAVAVGTGFGFSWLNGRYGAPNQPLKVPGLGWDADLVGAGLGAGAYLFGIGGRYKELFLYSAVGAATEYASRHGYAMGQTALGTAIGNTGSAAAAGQQGAGAIAGAQYAGAIAGTQYAGAASGAQYAGGVPGMQYQQ